MSGCGQMFLQLGKGNRFIFIETLGRLSAGKATDLIRYRFEPCDEGFTDIHVLGD